MVDKHGIKITHTYDLDGKKTFIIGVMRDSEVLHYSFLADRVIDIVNFLSKAYDSQAYSVKEDGLRRVYLINEPSILIYFIE